MLIPPGAMVLRKPTAAAAKTASPTRPKRPKAAGKPTVPSRATGAMAMVHSLGTRTILNRATRNLAKAAILP